MQTLKDSELRYRRLFEAAQDGILILDAKTGMIEDVNPYLIKMLGYSHEEFVKKKLWEVGAFRDIESSKDAFEALLENEYIRYENLPLKTKSGQLIQVEFVSSVYLVGDEKVIQCNIRDITEHKRIIAALEANENIYHDLINQSPDGYFIIDLSGSILTVNKAMCKELEFSEEEFLSMNIWEIIPEQYLDQYKERLTNILEGKSLKDAAEYRVRGKHGGNHYVEVLSAPRYSGKDIIGFQGVARDITARKRAEDALRESERRFRLASWATKDVVWERDFPTDTISWNDSLQKLFHYPVEEIEPTVAWWQDHIHPAERVKVIYSIQAAIDQEWDFWSKEYRFRLVDGSYANIFDRGYILYDAQGEPVQMIGAMVDITERKQAEEALQLSEEKYRMLVNEVNDGFYMTDSEGIFTFANPALAQMYGVENPQALVGCKFSDFAASEMPAKHSETYNNAMRVGHTPEVINGQITRPDGTCVFIEIKPAMIVKEGQVVGSRGIVRDVTEHKQAEKKIHRQIDYLTALQDIDRTIASAFDIHQSLNALISKAVSLLAVDAAAVLLINFTMNSLEFVAWNGFRTNAVETSIVKLDESYAGKAAMEQRIVKIPDLRSEPDKLFFTGFFEGEGFIGYYGVPLIVNGKVIGVLEVFQRSLIKRDQEWLDFLNALAGQAAVAISNAQLFDNLQHSNSELIQAYDATIEGWSRALDLRDKETEGHSQRVTQMTVNLARAFGLSEAELIQVRWGALLHDIGKMGVPDGILLKPGSLTEEEWVVMRKHPIFAYEMLSPVRYLRLALDIPYCHHEKWDGSGYPQGLKGEQIPLTARIFAIVDVWDALRSDRPYRLAWTEEKIHEHILASTGTHFDPQVVDAFLKMIEASERG